LARTSPVFVSSTMAPGTGDRGRDPAPVEEGACMPLVSKEPAFSIEQNKYKSQQKNALRLDSSTKD